MVAGGTFDRFHKGHRAFLSAAFSVGRRVSIAVTSDGFLRAGQKGRAELIQDYGTRVGVVKDFLGAAGLMARARLFKIDDRCGDADKNERYEAIVVTEETKAGALEINGLRAKAGLPRLVVVEVPLALAEDGVPISSTRIRAGVIDSEGKSLRNCGMAGVGNEIRRNLGELLKGRGSAYGYELYKLYRATYGRVSLRLVYYHLAKGCTEGIFQVKEVKSSEGGYSWGKQADRVYYELGPAAVARTTQKAKNSLA